LLIRIQGQTKNYDWGSKDLIPNYFGIPESKEKIAEIWFGTHPRGESVSDPGDVPLSKLIGKRLGFLVKLLSASKSLSIQVHPNKIQAQQGFEKEHNLGISLDDPARVYKDSSHKPETLIALTQFHALCGFRPRAELTQVFTSFGRSESEFKVLAQEISSGEPLELIFKSLIGNTSLVKRFLQTVPATQADSLAQRGRDLVANLLEQYPGDTGALVALMLNEVELSSGEAIFLPAGNVHAYLSGLGLEVMAASDNVLRCGLTPKHIDVAELLKIADFRELKNPKIAPKKLAEGLVEYPVDVADFRVYRAEVSGKNILADIDLPSSAIVVCTAGEVAVSTSLNEREVLSKQHVVYVAGAKKISLSGSGTVFVVLGN
jgi:mannose-6-phosphate isomerase